MNRRDFLLMTAAGSLALGVPGAGLLYGQPHRFHAAAHPEMLHALGRNRLVDAVGRAYRSAHPEEDDAETLGHLLLAEGDRSSSDVPSDHPLQARLQQQVRADFAAGRTVQLDGWILSVTEARQCALYSILSF